jgi:eukaryotic-like serine/threonine-protein kinase
MPKSPSPPPEAALPLHSPDAETRVAGRQPAGSPADMATRMMDFIPDGPSSGSPNLSGMPEQLGPYRLVKQLGRGGMGAVYLAEDTQLRRATALKVMLPAVACDRQARERFLREARAVAAIRNDHVVTVYQVGEENGMPFIAMELLRGAPLDAYLAKEQPPTMTAILRLAREIATGLAAAHDKNLVHRDIKPANIWLEAPKGRVKILDFGLARPTKPDTEDVDRLTHDGMVMGTPAYMSPEQARGQAVDFRTDLFSLGVVLYRLATSKLPFEGPTATAVLTQLAVATPPSAVELNPQVPQVFSDLIDRLLEKKPGDRPKSARAVADSLKQMDVTQTRPAAPRTPVRPVLEPEIVDEDETERISQPVRPRRRRRRKQKSSVDWVMGAGAVLALVALAVGVPIALYKALPARKATETKLPEPAAAPQAAKTSVAPAASRADQPQSQPMPITRQEPPPDRRPPPPPPEHRPGELPPPGFPQPPPPQGRPPLGPPRGP